MRVPLDYAVSAALAARAGAIGARNLLVHYDSGPDGSWVRGSQPLLRRMIDNLLDNAIGHNRAGGWIRVATTVATTGAGRQARLVVENGGAVLDPAQVAGLGQPFRRLGADRTGPGGAGLGLSIVAAIAEAHGGGLRLDARPEGGLRASVALPVTVPAPAPAPGGHAGRGRRMRVLVAEDARPLADVLAEGLRDAGMAVDVARDGLEAAAKLDATAYDVVVLDRDLPGLHGDTLCQMITVRDGRAMVLMLTAAGAPGDRVSGLALGADDYLGKPFHFPELVLRIRALGRRQPAARARTLRAAGIELDPVRRAAARDGRPLDLSVKEFGVLEALLAASPGYLRAEDLLEQVWDEHADPFTNTVAVTIGRLRRKLGDPPVITTRPGSATGSLIRADHRCPGQAAGPGTRPSRCSPPANPAWSSPVCGRYGRCGVAITACVALGKRLTVGKEKATPGGYGGKPPGVALIGVPTGARNAGRCSDGGPEHRYACYTETPPCASRPDDRAGSGQGIR